MKKFERYAAQGDCLIAKVESLPSDAIRQEPINGNYIVAHSETGHHHMITDQGVDLYQCANDPLAMFLVVNNEADLIHNRSFDTHETIRFDPGVYKIHRQREYTPKGWRRVAD